MRAIRKISAVLLALLALVSSTSFMVGLHLCMGEVQNVALFGKAAGCEKELTLPPCHRDTTAPCCDDETILHKGDDFKASLKWVHVSPPAPLDLEQPLVLISEIIPAAPASPTQYCNYDPPLRSCDLTVEHGVFLI